MQRHIGADAARIALRIVRLNPPQRCIVVVVRTLGLCIAEEPGVRSRRVLASCADPRFIALSVIDPPGGHATLALTSAMNLAPPHRFPSCRGLIVLSGYHEDAERRTHRRQRSPSCRSLLRS
jgi:hypothetical protein